MFSEAEHSKSFSIIDVSDEGASHQKGRIHEKNDQFICISYT